MILLNKINASVQDTKVLYQNPFNTSSSLNQLLSKTIRVSVAPARMCIGCKKSVKKVQGGYCYRCSQTLACCDLCILKPHLCHFHKGTCREPAWGEKHCFANHVVYLSLTSSFKVGITRAHQFLTRWVDQGASQAAILASVPTRLKAGLLENELAKNFNDKTNWRHLLTGQQISSESFGIEFSKLQALVRKQTLVAQQEIDLHPMKIQFLEYPVEKFLEKAKSINLDKTPFFEDKLVGIKGQYLLFENTGGLNMRKYQGYDITLELVDAK